MVVATFFFIAALLFAIGAFIKFKKVSWLISGYNTSSKEEKEKFDIDKLCNHMGNFVFILASIWALIALFSLLLPNNMGAVVVIGIVAEAIAIVIGIIYLNTDKRVYK